MWGPLRIDEEYGRLRGARCLQGRCADGLLVKSERGGRLTLRCTFSRYVAHSRSRSWERTSWDHLNGKKSQPPPSSFELLDGE